MADDMTKKTGDVEMGEATAQATTTEVLSAKATPAAGGSSDIHDLIVKCDVFVFSNTTCPYSVEVKKTLRAHGIKYSVMEVDKEKEQERILAFLTKETGSRSVPKIFVNGVCIGGSSDLKKIEFKGHIYKVFGKYMTGRPEKSSHRITSLGLFHYPDTVNEHALRIESFLVFVYTLYLIIFYNQISTPWIALYLAIDFGLRVLFGSSATPLGIGAAWLTLSFEPKWVAGPPKQFAAFFGLAFATFSAGLYLGGRHDGGAVLAAILMILSIFEWALGFSLGVWLFDFAIQRRLISGGVYHAHLSLLESRKWLYNFSTPKHNTLPAPTSQRVLLQGQEKNSDVDLIRKNRIDTNFKQQDVSVLKHLRIDFFAIPMTLVALGFGFQIINNGSVNVFNGQPVGKWDTEGAFYVLSILAAIIFCVLHILYLLHWFLHPSKVAKEWQHPVSGNFFSTYSITGMLFGLSIMYHNHVGGVTLVWIGATVQMLITVLRISDMVYGRVSEEFLNPSLLLVPVGNFIAALGFSFYASVYEGPTRNLTMNYTYIARLWFAAASLFGLVLFTTTFRKSILDVHSDERTRFTLWIWLAVFSIAGPAYLGVSRFDPAVGSGVLFQSLYCIALFFGVVLVVGWLKGFFSYVEDLNIWLMAFSFDLLALNAAFYYYYTYDKFSEVLVYFAFAFASGSTAVCLLHTLVWLFDGSLFKPRNKWGPASFSILTHEAFRAALPQLVLKLKYLDATSKHSLGSFLRELESTFVVFSEHGKHEDKFLFPAVRRFFPGLFSVGDEQHEQLDRTLKSIIGAVKEFHGEVANSNNIEDHATLANNLLQLLRETLPAWVELALKHFRGEEENITVGIRKYVPIDKQIELTAASFAETSPEAWAVILPFVVKHLPNPVWKVRYVKSFLWADPSRAQEIGLHLYRGCDDVEWALLSQQIPTIVPRGLAGHVKIY